MPSTIRPEEPADAAPVRKLVVDAFTQTSFGYGGEADLVEALRDTQGSISLVALDEHSICGHILFTRVTIAGENSARPSRSSGPPRSISGLGLAPMAVAPSHQGQGIGTSLVTRGLSIAQDRSEPFVVVFGHAEYYPRFGFTPARDFGVTHAFEELPQEPFFLRVLDSSVASLLRNGIARYDDVFGAQR